MSFERIYPQATKALLALDVNPRLISSFFFQKEREEEKDIEYLVKKGVQRKYIREVPDDLLSFNLWQSALYLGDLDRHQFTTFFRELSEAKRRLTINSNSKKNSLERFSKHIESIINHTNKSAGPVDISIHGHLNSGLVIGEWLASNSKINIIALGDEKSAEYNPGGIIFDSMKMSTQPIDRQMELDCDYLLHFSPKLTVEVANTLNAEKLIELNPYSVRSEAVGLLETRGIQYFPALLCGYPGEISGSRTLESILREAQKRSASKRQSISTSIYQMAGENLKEILNI